jgi:hypothetical protein
MVRAQQHLIRVALDALRPTQMTIGAAEVAAKRIQWGQLKRREREGLLASHWFPSVLGPGGRHFIVDHHHLGLALTQESVDKVWVMQLADFSEADPLMFWRLMEFHQWAHPYDERGRRCDWSKMPGRLARLRDDPYRSLAGAVRKAGGYAKDAAPFVEFLWADFFRSHFAPRSLRGAKGDVALPDETLREAVGLAHGTQARYLPGWSGVIAATPA